MQDHGIGLNLEELLVKDRNMHRSRFSHFYCEIYCHIKSFECTKGNEGN